MAHNEDRISRMTRSLQMYVPQNTTISMFCAAESSLERQIQEKENDLRNNMRNGSHATTLDLQNDLAQLVAQLKNHKSELSKMRMNIMQMVYRTIRDVYNQDAAEEARIDVYNQDAAEEARIDVPRV